MIGMQSQVRQEVSTSQQEDVSMRSANLPQVLKNWGQKLLPIGTGIFVNLAIKVTSIANFVSFVNKFTATKLSTKKMTTIGLDVISVIDGYFLLDSESYSLWSLEKEQKCSSY